MGGVVTMSEQAKRHERGSGRQDLPDDQFFWRVDPTEVALNSALSRRRTPGAADAKEWGCREWAVVSYCSNSPSPSECCAGWRRCTSAPTDV